METKSWATLTLLITLLATVLHLAGFFEPLWIFLDADNYHVAIGLWFSEGCGIEGTCIGTTPTLDFGITSDDTYHTSDFKWVQALETIGTIGALLLLILMAMYVYGYGEWRNLRKIYLAALLSSVIAWFFILLGVIVYCARFWKVVGTSNLISSTSFPWAMLQCFFAGIAYVIISLLIWLKCWSTGFVKTALPMSGESQMDLYPMSQRDTFRRFFNPPYHQSRRPNNALVFDNYDIYPPGIYDGYFDDGFDRRRVAAIDNMAYNDRYALERGLPYHQPVRPQTVLVSSPEPPPPEYVHTVLRETVPTRTVVPEGPVVERVLTRQNSAPAQTVVVTRPAPPEHHRTVVRDTAPSHTVVYQDFDGRNGHALERVVTRRRSPPPQTVLVTKAEPPPPKNQHHHHRVVRETVPARTVVYEYDSDNREGHVVERVMSREHQERPPTVVVTKPDPPPTEQRHHTVVRETIPAHSVVYEYDTESPAPYEDIALDGSINSICLPRYTRDPVVKPAETQPVRVVQRTVVPDASDDVYYSDRNVNRFRPVDPDPVVYRESPLADRDDLRGTSFRETRYYPDDVYPRRNVTAGNGMRTEMEEQYVTRPIYTASKPYTPSTRRYIVTENGVGGRRTPTADYMPAETYVSRTLGQGLQEGNIIRQAYSAPLITSSRTYADPPRQYLLADRGTDSRFTYDGRMRADTDYMVDEYNRYDQTPLDSNGGSALRYTTHVNPFSRPTTFLGNRAGMGDSTYIYRPTQLQYY